MPKGKIGVTYVTQECKHCGTSFQVVKGREKYKQTCSDACRVASGAKTRSTGRTLVVRPCPTCGTEFSVFKGLEKNKQYCSVVCGQKARSAALSRDETRICGHCGVGFTAKKSSAVRFCSNACAGLHKRKRVHRHCLVCEKQFEVYEKSPVRHCSEDCGAKAKEIAPTHTVVCKQCSKVELVDVSRAARYVYCSQKCMHACPEHKSLKSSRFSGENNPQYKDGSTYTTMSASGKVYSRQPLEKELARSAKRRATKQNAVPGWADLKAIEEIYAKARRFTELTGEPFHVDHKVPLISDLVCGLHWEQNLQILPGAENLSKGNKVWDDMP